MSALLSVIDNSGHCRVRPRHVCLSPPCASVCKQWARPARLRRPGLDQISDTWCTCGRQRVGVSPANEHAPNLLPWCMRAEGGGYRRDHLRALAQRVEVDAKEVRIMGSKSALLRTLVAGSSAKTAGFEVPSSVPKWRALGDSNPCYRRERVARPSLAVHARVTNPRKPLQYRAYRYMLVYACFSA